MVELVLIVGSGVVGFAVGAVACALRIPKILARLSDTALSDLADQVADEREHR